MNTDDPAFLWETEALRTSRAKPNKAAPRVSTTTAPTDAGFATLAEASSQTGIPVNTLRKWSRRGLVTSYLDMRSEKPIRMVNMEAVHARAESLGRDVEAQEATIDLTQRATIAASRTPPPPVVNADDPPQGTMIVPISAWEKMLNQLGNLHEAGREMAEARERAAKAETEAMFLRERLKELRAELETQRSAEPDGPAPEPATDAGGSRQLAPQAIRSLWDRASAWRRRR